MSSDTEALKLSQRDGYTNPMAIAKHYGSLSQITHVSQIKLTEWMNKVYDTTTAKTISTKQTFWKISLGSWMLNRL